MAFTGTGWERCQEVSRHCAFSPDVTAGQANVMLARAHDLLHTRGGVWEPRGGLSAAAGEAEPQRGRSFACRRNQLRGERSTPHGGSVRRTIATWTRLTPSAVSSPTKAENSLKPEKNQTPNMATT
jgi:hypothetical protein